MSKFLQLKNIRYYYNPGFVLHIPDLDIEQGTITGLAGPNGSGKTTLLKIMALVEECSSGAVIFSGRQVSKNDSKARFAISLLLQEPYLLKRSVFENIAYGLRLRGKTGNLAGAVHEGLDLVGLPRAYSSRRWYELSGGEAQRVALAARLALQPACLLLDEPTASIDMESARIIRRAILTARTERNTTLVIASHDRSWLNDICDNIIHLYNGRMLSCSSENILLGPWDQEGDRLRRRLSDGQYIQLPYSASTGTGVVLPPECLQISDSLEETARVCKLKGVVTNIFLDPKSRKPRLQVRCGDQAFLASINENNFADQYVWPGKQVVLEYKPEDIMWLESKEV